MLLAYGPNLGRSISPHLNRDANNSFSDNASVISWRNPGNSELPRDDYILADPAFVKAAQEAKAMAFFPDLKLTKCSNNSFRIVKAPPTDFSIDILETESRYGISTFEASMRAAGTKCCGRGLYLSFVHPAQTRNIAICIQRYLGNDYADYYWYAIGDTDDNLANEAYLNLQHDYSGRTDTDLSLRDSGHYRNVIY